MLELVPPPVLYVVFWMVALLCDIALPWPAAWLRTDALHWVGWACLGVSLLFGLPSLAFFAANKTTVIPHARPAKLVIDGMYRLSRNPMYVAMTALYVAVTIHAGSPWPFLFLVVPLAILHKVIIPMEEKHLADVFGEEYLAYCRRVRRWL
jgi:protein-S-isoprenylcysteine O-methyltransferase Ste14